MAFVPAWYLLMAALTGHQPLTFRLFSTGQVLAADGRHLTLISAGLSSLTLVTGFAAFAAIHKTLAFDRRLVSAGYRQPTLIAAKTAAIAVVAVGVAGYTAAVLLVFWRPDPAGCLAIAARGASAAHCLLRWLAWAGCPGSALLSAAGAGASVRGGHAAVLASAGGGTARTGQPTRARQ